MSAPQIPPGGTWFDTHRKSFADVPIDPGDHGIATSEFLDAAESTTTLFDVLGSVAFTPVKSDMTGNIAKVRTYQLAHPAESTTLQSLVKSELSGTPKSHTATEGLLWLVRGLDFTAQSLRNELTSNAGVSPTAAKPNKEMSENFRAAYKSTLAQYHSMFVKPVFGAAMGATPYRKDFYKKLVGSEVKGEEGEGKVLGQMTQWLEALEKQIGILKPFMASKDAQWK